MVCTTLFLWPNSVQGDRNRAIRVQQEPLRFYEEAQRRWSHLEVEKWKQLVFAKNRGIYMSCFLTWLRINYDTWTYERLSFTKAFKLVLWTQSCPKEMLVRSYCPSETCLTSSSGTQWSPLIGPMGPMLIYFNRDVENYTLGRRCWWVFWSK